MDGQDFWWWKAGDGRQEAIDIFEQRYCTDSSGCDDAERWTGSLQDIRNIPGSDNHADEREEQDELQGFSLGVDEYISKPFSAKFCLVARVEAILRRSSTMSRK